MGKGQFIFEKETGDNRRAHSLVLLPGFCRSDDLVIGSNDGFFQQQRLLQEATLLVDMFFFQLAKLLAYIMVYLGYCERAGYLTGLVTAHAVCQYRNTVSIIRNRTVFIMRSSTADIAPGNNLKFCRQIHLLFIFFSVVYAPCEELASTILHFPTACVCCVSSVP